MDDWCKTCGRTMHDHLAANHEFVSTLSGVFPKAEEKEDDMNILEVNSVATKLEETIDKDGFVDIGKGVAEHFGVSENLMRMAIKQLEQQGFTTQSYRVQQIGTNNFVTMTVLQGENVSYRDVYNEVNGLKNIPASETRAAVAEMRLTKKQELTYKCFELMNKGMSKVAIAKTLGVSESTVRSILAVAIPEVGLEREIAQVLNKYSAENGSNTPDFILAEYLMACLNAFNLANNRAKEFHGEGVLNDEG